MSDEAPKVILKPLKPISSSMMTGVLYDRKAKELHIGFNTGARYKYKNVPYSKYQGLLKSPSKGKYLNSKIKSKHEFEKMEEMQKEAFFRAFLHEVKKLLDIPSGVPIHRSFSSFMETVHPGDVIVTKMSKADLAARAIELRQAVGLNSHFGWTHAALVKEGGDVIHSFHAPGSVADLKVRQDSLKSLFDSGLDMMVLKPAVSAEKKLEAVSRAEELKGVPYKWSSILSAAMGLGGNQLDKKPAAVICTGTIAHAYPDLKISKSGATDNMLVSDLINSPSFTPSAAITH